MFRLMAFNILTDNKDDHAKNFSFICRAGKWEMAPAYDLTRCTAGYNGEHATSVNYNGNPSVDDMVKVGESIGIVRAKGGSIIRDVAANCEEILSDDYADVRKI